MPLLLLVTRPRDISIVGDPESYGVLVELLRNPGDAVVTLDELADPKPYSDSLRYIEVLHSWDKVRVSLLSDRLVFEGDTPYLDVIASNIEFAIGGNSSPSSGHHVHIEYYDEHPYLREDSLPFVVEVKRHG